jgi:hypothetical protein
VYIMIARLGNVLYWASSGIAVLLLLWLAGAVIAAIINGEPMNDFGLMSFLMVGSAALIWLFGRAYRYVLAGT